MVKEQLVFQCTDDMHMKALALFIQKASKFESKIHIYRESRRANAKSLLGVMSLGIENGVTLDLVADGRDELEAVTVLKDYLSTL